MARSRADDKIQSYRFHVVEATGTFLTPTAGFKSVTTPDITLAVAEYRDGLILYTWKQPGIPTVGNSRLTQGTLATVSQFFQWISDAIGGAEYRADLNINVYNESPVDTKNSVPVKQQQLLNAFPIINKNIGDLDSTNSEINIRELELSIEQFTETK